MVIRSVVGFCLDNALNNTLLHYDYERDKPDGYPEAHLQICAESADWASACPKIGPTRALDRLHFPVGGRKYRPTLEDLVEFLVIEKLRAHRGWEAVIEAGRERFQRHRYPPPLSAWMRPFHEVQIAPSSRSTCRTSLDAMRRTQTCRGLMNPSTVAQNSREDPLGHIPSASTVDPAAVVAGDHVVPGRPDRLQVVHGPR
jgi:hypothetical protein